MFKVEESAKSVIPVIQNWAASITDYRIRVYLHGSRIYGTSTIGSDLDVGIELIDKHTFMDLMRLPNGLKEQWQDSLCLHIFSFPVHVELYRRYDPIKSKVFPTKAASYLIYDSEKTPPETVEGINLETIYKKAKPP
jgi:predicted nucleotidyltransferase